MELVRCYYRSFAKTQSAVRVGKELGERCRTTVGPRQGDPISPTKFISYLERVMVVVKDNNTGVSAQGILFNNLQFTDDIDLLEECRDKLQDNLRIVDEAGKAVGLKININKTKTMVSGGDDNGQHVVVDDW